MEEDSCNELYSYKYATRTEAITVTVYDTKLFQRVKHVLTSQYNFKSSKNQNGIEAIKFENNLKYVVTLYNNNRTLFIQGKGCKLWKQSVLDDIMEIEALNVSSDELTPLSSPQTPVEHTPSRIKSSCLS